MPLMMVSPDSESVETRKDGSSAGQLVERHGHLFLVGLGLGLDLHFDDGIGEFHLLEDGRLVRVAQRVAGAGFLETDEGDDVAGIGVGDFLAVVGVHENHAADALGLLAGRVQQRHALLTACRNRCGRR